MKELLYYAKNLELDFDNKNPKYQSMIDLAISSLVTGNYSKSIEMFDKAIELDSNYPSAWLGKAFAEIAEVSDERFNSLRIDEYLQRALRSTDNITNYKVAIAGCLAYRHASIIKKCVISVEKAIQAKQEAEKAKSRGISTAMVGSMFTGRDKSLTSNIVGGALIAGGATYAVNSHFKAKELEQLGNSLYTAALSQTYLSIPIVRLCGELLENINDVQLNANFNVVLDSWKDSVIYLYNKQREQLVNRLNKLNISDAEAIQKLLSSPNSIQEIGEFTSFMKIIGLSNHKIFSKLNILFTETLKSHFDNEGALTELNIAKQKQNKAIIMTVVVVLIGFISAYYRDEELHQDNQWLEWLLDAAGIGLGVYLYNKAKTSNMKNFEIEYKAAVNDLKNIDIKTSDFNLKLIES
jgi:tetratricopeptide (TPR) repeat protein